MHTECTQGEGSIGYCVPDAIGLLAHLYCWLTGLVVLQASGNFIPDCQTTAKFYQVNDNIAEKFSISASGVALFRNITRSPLALLRTGV